MNDNIIIEYNKIINNSCIEYIQNQLLLYFNKNSWEKYVDSLRFGQCQLIAKIVYNICPTKVEIYEVEEHFCKNSIKQLQLIGDSDLMCGTHYIVKINNIFYDFAKGANTINNIYLVGTNQQKYTIDLSLNELNCFTKFIIRDCDYWDHIKIKKSKIKPYEE